MPETPETEVVRNKVITPRTISRATDTTAAGAISAILYAYGLIPVEVLPPLQVLLGIVFVAIRGWLEPQERRSE